MPTGQLAVPNMVAMVEIEAALNVEAACETKCAPDALVGHLWRRSPQFLSCCIPVAGEIKRFIKSWTLDSLPSAPFP
jgi:hypothetical protein